MRRDDFTTPPTYHSSKSFSMRSTVSGEVEVALHASIDLRLRQRLSLAPTAASQCSPRGLGPGGRLRSCDESKRAPRRAPVKASRDPSSLA